MPPFSVTVHLYVTKRTIFHVKFLATLNFQPECYFILNSCNFYLSFLSNTLTSKLFVEHVIIPYSTEENLFLISNITMGL